MLIWVAYRDENEFLTISAFWQHHRYKVQEIYQGFIANYENAANVQKSKFLGEFLEYDDAIKRCSDHFNRVN